MKEIVDNKKRCKDVLCSSIGRINIVKMILPSKAILQIPYNHYQLPMAFFFTELQQKFLNVHRNRKDSK